MSTATMERPREAAAAQEILEFLTFRLGREEYGIDILQVQEIRSYEAPTRMVGTPDFIKGVIDLRGAIVPIIDLRIKLGCDKAEYDDFTVVIFLDIEGTLVGVVVDAVADVAQLAQEQIKPAPHCEGQLDAAFVRGIASVGQRMLILIDMAALLSASELTVVQPAEAFAS